MTATLLRVAWIHLKRDRVALALCFVLPVVFFSIFAAIFSGGGEGGARSIVVLLVDEDDTPTSRRFAETLDDMGALRLSRGPAASESNPDPAPWKRESAHRAVRSGKAPVAVVLPAGFESTFGDFGGDRPAVDLLFDSANPVARATVDGLLQGAAMQAAPDLLIRRGLDQLDRFGGGLTDAQKRALEIFLPVVRGERSPSSVTGDPRDDEAENSGFGGLVPVHSTEVGAEEDGRSMVAYYAASISVMFLLFSMVGAAGSILEEKERGTLERLLASRVSPGRILAANWIFYALLGVAQLSVMFAWGAAVFGLDLSSPKRLVGVAVMTVATSAAAAGFGLLMATHCTSRNQLQGVSTVLILVMSAVGGSMVPRFVMPPFMDQAALFTFNGWALDGYLKVLWYADPSATLGASLVTIGPEVAVLAGLTLVFLGLARRAARRWDAA